MTDLFFNLEEPPDQFNLHPATEGGVTTFLGGESSVAAFPFLLRPWQHSSFYIGGVRIVGRAAWGGAYPEWRNGVVYYNTRVKPLSEFLHAIVIHHTASNHGVRHVETMHRNRSYAAIGYHFFIDGQGVIYEGRPLEVMGAHAGNPGYDAGTMSNPDWGKIGIVLQGNYVKSVPSADMQTSLELLTRELKQAYSMSDLLMHRDNFGSP
jgi:hypothetical protein